MEACKLKQKKKKGNLRQITSHKIEPNNENEITLDTHSKNKKQI